MGVGPVGAAGSLSIANAAAISATRAASWATAATSVPSGTVASARTAAQSLTSARPIASERRKRASPARNQHHLEQRLRIEAVAQHRGQLRHGEDEDEVEEELERRDARGLLPPDVSGGSALNGDRL